MNILMISQEPPLDNSGVVTGNAVRSRQIAGALEVAGHNVQHSWLSKESGLYGRSRPARTFRNQDELRSILLERNPDAVLVSYWELISLLPHDSVPPVILDFVAPRPLEELFEAPERVQHNLRRLRSNLSRCDLIMVGNFEQTQLLTYPLLEAGFDLKEGTPVVIVPLGAKPVEPTRRNEPDPQWLLVAGGVNWPWRSGGSFALALESVARNESIPLRLMHFGSQNGEQERDEKVSGTAGIIHRPLMPYREFGEFLSNDCHVGVELAEWNIERSYSQSFRSLEFLRHGLPILCNNYLPIARKVNQYDAGWVVATADELPGLVVDIIGDTESWRRKSANALELVRSEFDPKKSVLPLLDWLADMPAAKRLAPRPTIEDKDPVLGVPPWRIRIGNQFRLARRVAYARFFGKPRDNGVILVTRGDLFPTDHGAAVRTVASARALAAAGARVAIVTDDRKYWVEVAAAGLTRRRYPLWTRLVSAPGWLTKLLHYSKDLPFSNSFLYLPLSDRSFYWRVLAVLGRTGCRILQAEFPAFAEPCLRIRQLIDVRVVLVEHNVEYERLKAQVAELTDGQYSNLKSIELKLCNEADAVVCVSDNDRQKLADDGVADQRLHTVAHGVNLQQFDEAAPIDIRADKGIDPKEPVLAFHGTFSYPPNLKALQVLGEVILPGLESKGIRAHVAAIGRQPPAVAAHPRIHLIGSVDELAPWLKGCDLAVVPLTDGGGTRMKIIDCFAASLPVITTGKGIEGISAVPDQHAVFRDDWPGFIDAIEALLKSPKRRAELAANGRKLAESMDWARVARRYLAIYSGL